MKHTNQSSLIPLSIAISKSLQRHEHVYDIVKEIVEFEPFSKQVISSITDQLSEVSFTDCGKKLLKII